MKKGQKMFRVTYKLVKLVSGSIIGKPKIYGIDNVDDSQVNIFMANHQRLYGPLAAMCYLPFKTRVWATSNIVFKDECKKYMRETAFKYNMGCSNFKSWLYSIFTYRLVSGAVQSTNPIPSYWDLKRAMKSIEMGTQAYMDGSSQFIFAKSKLGKEKGFREDFDFMKGYQLVLKNVMVHGKLPVIYPVAMNSERGHMAIGKPIVPDPNNKWTLERKRINKYLVEQVKLGYYEPEAMSGSKEITTSNIVYAW